jgi:hypothetical protein
MTITKAVYKIFRGWYVSHATFPIRLDRSILIFLKLHGKFPLGVVEGPSRATLAAVDYEMLMDLLLASMCYGPLLRLFRDKTKGFYYGVLESVSFDLYFKFLLSLKYTVALR